jgi:hypothetical protein
MPYKPPGHIQIPLKTRELLDTWKDKGETWENFFLNLLKFWIDEHKKNKKISQGH